ncbi:biotin/lipoyl-binding protein [Undibacterium oligocarboniphilum]|uniref:Biotin/lipoyl-binding protein n=1 Tax=Undibacterium oligocarboniphilum TaxID=666702 RepID=A0A850Q9X4_9BURK|nr:biotin/lipoyl-binding protein [Undibacterium oligocarboniphilum]MBC3869142.1 biotin/lipoyl-binding protein [Undibacterium oligocarboniphilum]NVO77122.1 biotin/lipoyl-binding protein [Undibacterium oligocarboniphilum]
MRSPDRSISPVSAVNNSLSLQIRRLFSLHTVQRVLISLPVVALVACGNQAAGGAAGAGKMPPPEVNVVTVNQRDLAVDFEYVGQTAGSKETEIRARVPGILENRLYEEGSRVKAGTVLFQIDPGT